MDICLSVIPAAYNEAEKSKYGISNRLFRALRDTFDVRWMQSRVIRTQFEELEVQEDVATESAGNNQ